MSASTPLFYQCTTCQTVAGPAASSAPKNLAIFIDGTSNKPSDPDQNTNVFKLFSNVAESSMTTGPGVEQRKFYKMGIGAHYTGHLTSLGRMKRGITSGFEMAFARNVGENVKEAYAWLVDTYRTGDRIYLFGFSRGAYQVRALASMIHEVGLATKKEYCKTAYEHYLSIDFYKPQARPLITQFKSEFCWPGVRIHFIGVWDTVSSLGLIKKDVHVTTSASVTNACHFRHALSLDELRVKFMPECFGEMNAHHSNIRSPRLAVSNVEEVWFAGSHSDVGGVYHKRHLGPILTYNAEGDRGSCAGSAGNVTIEWMRKEALTSGLIFEPKEFAWDPQDVLGTSESMTPLWKILEILPIRHQVSFSGTGEHKQRWHLSRPRSIIPNQHIHSSVLSVDTYTPRATLGNCTYNSIVLRKPSTSSQLDTTASLDEQARTQLLEPLLEDPQATLDSLEMVLPLVDSLNYEDNRQNPTKLQPKWNLSDVGDRSGLSQFALLVVYDATSKIADSNPLLNATRLSLRTILESFPDSIETMMEITRVLYVLRFLAKRPRLIKHFVDDNVTKALMIVLERTFRTPSGIQFLLVVDILGLISTEQPSNDVINALREIIQTKISDVQVSIHLIASLEMISHLAKYQKAKNLCEEFKPKLYELAKKKGREIGSAAVKALVSMDAPLTRDIYICNTLGYLSDILPLLDVEVDSPPSPGPTGDLELPTPCRVNDNGIPDNEEFVGQVVSAIQSSNDRERMEATLTVVKLCKNVNARKFFKEKVPDIFVGQLKRKKTSLLAAYAWWKCLEYNMCTSNDDVALALVSMVEKNWFDDAIGRVEGCTIFRGLMSFHGLRDKVMPKILPTLVTVLAGGQRHQTRMSLICIDILDERSPLDLNPVIEASMRHLDNTDKNVRMKGVKVISALAQTLAGERAIIQRLNDIIKMLPQPKGSSDSPVLSRPHVIGAVAVLYNVSKNETLREHILRSPEFIAWRGHHISRR